MRQFAPASMLLWCHCSARFRWLSRTCRCGNLKGHSCSVPAQVDRFSRGRQHDAPMNSHRVSLSSLLLLFAAAPIWVCDSRVNKR